MFNSTPASKFVPQEVAIHTPGKGWTRKVCKTEKAFDKLIEKCNEQGCETRVRNAEEV